MAQKKENLKEVLALLEKAKGFLPAWEEENTLPVGINALNYYQLGSTLLSIISISQKALFLDEDKLDDEVRIDIYNLLDLAKELIPWDELEFLDILRKGLG